jgi:hypothetical protein
MTTCVILHNMIIEDERDVILSFAFDNVAWPMNIEEIRIDLSTSWDIPTDRRQADTYLT